MLAALLGFLAPFLPDVIGMGKGWLDHKQEMEMMRLRLEHESKAHGWRMDEVEANAVAQDRLAARKPHEAYGPKLLNAAAKQEGRLLWRWAFNLAFLAYAVLDWLVVFVRPGVSYYVFGLWGAVKAATIYGVYLHVQAAGLDGGVAGDLARTLTNEATWTEFDRDLLLLIAAFWFSERLIRRRTGNV